MDGERAVEAGMTALEGPRGSDQHAMWKALLQLKTVLPYVSRFVPLLDLLGVGQAQGAGLSKEVRDNVTSIQTGQREVRIAVQDQALEIKRLEDQVAGLREAAEKNNFEHAKLAEDVKAMSRLVRGVGAGLAILLVVLILMVGVLLTRIAH